MYFIPQTKAYLANIINASQNTNGAPIKAMGLPIQIKAYSQQPRAVSLVANQTASAVVEISQITVERWLGNRNNPKDNPSLLIDGPTGVAIAGYINPLNAGRLTAKGPVQILVNVVDTDPTRGGQNRDYLMAGVAQTLLSAQIGELITDPVTNMNFTVKYIGEHVGFQVLDDQRLQNSTLVNFGGIVIFEEIIIDFIG